MKVRSDFLKNYNDTRKAIGYVPRKEATQKDYDRIGFMSGLEVHQQLKTKEKLFCRCPAGIYQEDDDYDAEIIRHMRPTLSELGEYDGTALMEFKTRKEIIYRIKNRTACTYEVDDTPPFKIDREALEIALEISLLCRLNVVGEVHITRKQYLDGSIPTGFQRTGIIGVEGEIYLQNKKVRLMQLSLEEDSCREISDIRHTRIYKTDRLGMPLIETVTYPDMVNPEEVREAAEYIRFLNRSTGKVRTGIGAGREDVNVSCSGGTRVEIKGVSHNKWIPELTHNECYRQWALLHIKDLLNKKIKDPGKWKISHSEVKHKDFTIDYAPVKDAKKAGYKLMAVRLPGFKGIMSHFTQPDKVFANELSDRLKVIACIEKPNMLHSESLEIDIEEKYRKKLSALLKLEKDDAWVIFWGPDEDIETALETIEERCLIAFERVPNESRKSFEDGTTIFERVLPGPDRMYPDTDSAPIPLEDEYIENLRKNMPVDVVDRYKQLKEWGVPEDTYHYLLKNNFVPLMEKICNDLKINCKYLGIFLGHKFKFIQGHYSPVSEFSYDQIYDMFKFIKKKKLNINIAGRMLAVIYEHPKMDYESVLTTIKYKKRTGEEIIGNIDFLKEKFNKIGIVKTPGNKVNWVMGQLKSHAVGNIDMKELRKKVVKN